jgi:hypothetical protein
MAAPSVVSRSPGVNEVNVYVNEYIEVLFNQNLNQATLNDNTILLYRVTDYQIMDKMWSFDTGTYKLTITPNIVFDQNTQYNVVLVGADQSSSCIKNISDEAMALSVTWNFTTGTGVRDPQGDVGESEEAADLETAESPVSKVLPAKTTDDLIITGTIPENYSANMGVMNGDYATAHYSGPIKVTFNRPVASGVLVEQDWIVLEAQSVDGDPSTVVSLPSGVVSNVNGDSLYWTPSNYNGNDYAWCINNEITVTVSKDVTDYAGLPLGADYRFMFTLPYRPFYCTVPRIRAVIGSFIRDIPDDTVARNIYLNSIEAYNIANTIYSQYTWGIDSPTFAAKMWTCCKTQYDLLYAKLLDMASVGPGMIKRLGDFTIQESTDIQAGIKGALEKSLECSNAWLKLLLGKYRRAKAKMTVKGVASPATPPVRGVRTWTLETGRDTLGANKTLTRRIKSPGIYSDWS